MISFNHVFFYLKSFAFLLTISLTNNKNVTNNKIKNKYINTLYQFHFLTLLNIFAKNKAPFFQ